METRTFAEQSRPYLDYLAEWYAHLPVLNLAAEVEPRRTALISEDLVKGFCTVGPLASPRVQAIVPAVARLFERAYALGVRHFLLPQDTHEPAAVEFRSFPAHCVRGTDEAQMVPELAALPFASHFTVIPKNSLDPSLTEEFGAWLAQHGDVNTFIVVGDCTDLCVYQIAMSLRVQANQRQRADVRVIVPADCVNTYQVTVEAARSVGGLPHGGDLFHVVFLYHMALNGIEVAGTAR
jgi:nicotinamidase-related amidase